jgi:hypothetical protein
MTGMAANPSYQIIYQVMAPLLGQFTTRNAILLACRNAGRDADQLVPEDVENITVQLQPMMRTLLGERLSRRAVLEIRQRLEGVAVS